LIRGFKFIRQEGEPVTIKAVIFDLDGTITSFNVDYMTIRAEVRSLLMSAGLPASVLSTNESIFEMLKKAEIFVKNTGKPRKTFDDVREKALGIAEKYEIEAARSTSLLSGVEETLKTVKRMNLKIGLCTINGERSTNYILKRFKIAEYFDAVTPRNKVKYVKPNTEHLEATLKTLEVNPEEAILVGDGTRDMQCAHELKVVSIGLPTGLSTEKELIASGANYFITSITDLPTLIEAINKT
jgi:phosphoglycolate phosphatase